MINHGSWILMDFGVGVLDSGSWILVLRCTLPGILMVSFVVRFFVILSCQKVDAEALKPAFATAMVVFSFFLGISLGTAENVNEFR